MKFYTSLALVLSIIASGCSQSTPKLSGVWRADDTFSERNITYQRTQVLEFRNNGTLLLITTSTSKKTIINLVNDAKYSINRSDIEFTPTVYYADITNLTRKTTKRKNLMEENPKEYSQTYLVPYAFRPGVLTMTGKDGKKLDYRRIR